MSAVLWVVGIVLILGGASLIMMPRLVVLGVLLVIAGIAAGPFGAVIYYPGG